MADEENTESTEDEEAGEKKGGMMKIILLVNGLLLIIGISVGAAMFFMGGDEAPETAQGDSEVMGEGDEPVEKEEI